MISWAGWWIQIPSATPLPLNKWNAHFWIMFIFWWLDRLASGLELLPTPISQKNEMLIFGLLSLLLMGWAGWWTQILSATPLQPKKWSAHFWITFNIWWSAGLINGLESHLPPLSSQNDEMPIFVLCWTSNNQPGCSMDSNPIHYPSPAKIMRCLFLHYIQLLIISWAGQWTWIPSATSLQPKKWNAHFWITFNFWWSVGLVNGFEPCPPPLSS